MTSDLDHARLRALTFEVAVLADLDLRPGPGGVAVGTSDAFEIAWSIVADTVGDPVVADGAATLSARTALTQLVRQSLALRALPAGAWRTRLRPWGAAVGSLTHPGDRWRQAAVMGGALDLGLALVTDRGDPDGLEVLRPAALDLAGLSATEAWAFAADYLEHMGKVGAERLTEIEDVRRSSRHAVLRPIGDADVLTLLGSKAYRSGLAARDGSGMCAVAVPMRTRGWLDLRALDPAFVPAAAAATEPESRGFERPVLVTADEVKAPATR